MSRRPSALALRPSTRLSSDRRAQSFLARRRTRAVEPEEEGAEDDDGENEGERPAADEVLARAAERARAGAAVGGCCCCSRGRGACWEERLERYGRGHAVNVREAEAERTRRRDASFFARHSARLSGPCLVQFVCSQFSPRSPTATTTTTQTCSNDQVVSPAGRARCHRRPQPAHIRQPAHVDQQGGFRPGCRLSPTEVRRLTGSLAQTRFLANLDD